jgi:release factor glutamine methyltransferase
MKTYGELVQRGSELLMHRSPSAQLDVYLLLGLACDKTRLSILACRDELVPAAQQERFLALLERRMRGEPIAYILGEREFYGRSFIVSPAVLIPRPETELLVARALEVARNHSGAPIEILDLGTGSGCIAVTLAAELCRTGIACAITAVDLRPESLAVAEQNAIRHGVRESITFKESNWFSCFEEKRRIPKFSCIVSNPPYIGIGEEVTADTAFEPQHALYAGRDGLNDLWQILSHATSYLNNHGVLICEIGHLQQEPLRKMLQRELSGSYGDPVFIQDLSGRDRLIEVMVKNT